MRICTLRRLFGVQPPLRLRDHHLYAATLSQRVTRILVPCNQAQSKRGSEALRRSIWLGIMRVFEQMRCAIGGVARSTMRRHARKFLKKTERCQDVQQESLRRLLELNADSRFSRTHGIDRVRTVEEFRKTLPVTDYEFVRSAIDQVKNGDHQALLGTKNRLLMFSLSSGTTSESKFIPITEQFLADYRRGWQSWGIMALDTHREVNALNIVQLTSDYDRFRTPGGTPCGNISGLVIAMQRPVVRLMYSVPGLVAKISDPEAKQYAALRLAVADPNVGMITTANPSTLLNLANMANRCREELVRDLFDGTISAKYEIDETIRKRLRWLSRRRRARARELEAIIEQTGTLYPKDFWPRTRIVAVWTGGSAGVYLKYLRPLYGEVAMRDHGLHASEGRMTIPLEDETASGVLDISTHFFEFIPESEHESRNPVVLQSHELQEGGTYYILLTTSSGLYRYDIQDVVRCTGFHGTTPMLEFLHKGAHISNITGEKVSESQVADAVKATIAGNSMRMRYFTIAPVWGEPPNYQLFVEAEDVSNERDRSKLAHEVDGRLQSLNCEYREKRETGRLAKLACVPLKSGTWDKFVKGRLNRLGGSVEQYKHPCLVPDLGFKAEISNGSHGNASGSTAIGPKLNGAAQATNGAIGTLASETTRRFDSGIRDALPDTAQPLPKPKPKPKLTKTKLS